MFYYYMVQKKVKVEDMDPDMEVWVMEKGELEVLHIQLSNRECIVSFPTIHVLNRTQSTVLIPQYSLSASCPTSFSSARCAFRTALQDSLRSIKFDAAFPSSALVHLFFLSFRRESCRTTTLGSQGSA